MVEAVTPPNPAGAGTKTTPDPTLLTIDSIRREITMLENLFDTRVVDAEALNKERFHSIDQLMDRSEEQRREQKQDTKAAVDAALDSQKEATAKMEKSISDQINALRFNFETEVRGIRTSVDDLKGRMTILEALKQGQHEQKTESRQVTAGVYAAIGLATTLILGALTIIGFFIATGAGGV